MKVIDLTVNGLELFVCVRELKPEIANVVHRSGQFGT